MESMATLLHTPEANRIAGEFSSLETLSAVIAWGRAHPDRVASRTVIADVVLQDEFSHDALVPLSTGLTIVFGST
jgi:hypothetical protein